MKNKIYFFPQYYCEITTDYQAQTWNILKRDNAVVVLNLEWSPQRRPWSFKKEKGIYFFIPFVFSLRGRVFFPTLSAFINLFVLFLYCNLHLNHFLSKKRILWLNNPDSVDFFHRFKRFFDFNLFDMVDFFETAENREQFRAMLSQVDMICANSETLFNQYRELNQNTHLVPQGFRLNEFKKKLTIRPKKYLGYIGGINSRLDYKLLIDLTEGNPNWQFLFCGPIFDYFPFQKKLIDKLLSQKNVIYLPPVAKKNVSKVMSTFQVGLIPYDIKNKLNQYSYPMKTFEYFYLGIPVISTPISELRKLSPLVKIGANTKQWEQLLTKTMKQKWPEKFRKIQKKYAVANNWEKKIATILSAMQKQKPQLRYPD